LIQKPLSLYEAVKRFMSNLYVIWLPNNHN